MSKRYANLALVYAIAAMVFGVFYREYTKFSHFSGKTNLSVMHTHYFLLGMFFFLMLMVIEKVFAFSDKSVGKTVFVYQAGLNITGIGFLIRGLTQVWGTQLSRGMDASISGIAGIGHILTGVSMVLILLKIKKQAE
jgi:small-conductance mechanosensitive channel